MLIWICALHCEAKPIIDFYRLKKSPLRNKFDLYSGNNIACIVSGIGGTNMEKSIRWAAEKFQDYELSWVNIGIAGHKNESIGNCFIISQVTQCSSGNSIFTKPINKSVLPRKQLISLNAPSTDYDSTALFDQEAYDFFNTTMQYSTIENCQSFKVVSDNEISSPHRNKAIISRLIAKRINDITNCISALKMQTQ